MWWLFAYPAVGSLAAALASYAQGDHETMRRGRGSRRPSYDPEHFLLALGFLALWPALFVFYLPFVAGAAARDRRLELEAARSLAERDAAAERARLDAEVEREVEECRLLCGDRR